MPEQLKTLLDNLRAFGPQKLAIMGGVAAFVVATVIGASIYLNKPSYETLYVGLDRGDINQIGMVLGENGIDFDVGSDGTTVLVPVGRTGPARMLLAERGLPTSTNAGYELFDNVGSFGLTSFMQQVTRVRALEGEIARTIQSIAGVKAARVHIVMQERANFRREEQRPSASVVIRTTGGDAGQQAVSIRHMVAAAVPGLSVEDVTVLDSAGTLLAAGDDPNNMALTRAMGVERQVEGQVEDNIRRALSPYLGYDNFRASVRAEVNTDSQQIEETIFDPESRVERSMQVVRSNDQSNQREASQSTSVQQNLPEEQAAPGAGPESSEQRERREETTNYEINSKRIATTSNGYSVSKMSIAVVVNQARLASVIGEEPTPEQIDARIAEIRQVVASATGFSEERGDVITVSAVEFMDGLEGAEPVAQSWLEAAGRHTGTMINALAFVVVVFLVSWFGLRPMTAALNRPQTAALAGPSFDEVQNSLPAPEEAAQVAASQALPGPAAGNVTDDLRRKLKPNPQERLARMVDLNEERTALILRKWAHKEAA
ncbi:MAG: flagellar M-ring protein FliF [Rhizobiaceae bacterium]|nr:flagellar M-ring protein FliF [Rhizobiaceae bacterium]